MIKENFGNELVNMIVNNLAEKMLPEVLARIGELQPSTKDETMDIKKASSYLDVSEEMLYRMVSSKSIPHWRIGTEESRRKAIRFSSISLDRWKREQESLNFIPRKE